MTRLLIAVLLLLSGSAHAQTWELVWADEFEGTGAPDPAKWTYDLGGNGWGNNELQHYTDRTDNARQQDGALVIEAREEAREGRAYTSARLVTRGRAAWTYGRIEARIQLPVGQGIWPAFWMLPTDSPYGGWPTGGEIDIMEYLGHDPDRTYGTLHYGGGDLGHRYTGTHYTLPSGDFPDAFHTFAIEWEPRRIRWFVDGTLYQTQSSWVSGGGPYPAPFDSPFHLLLNVAVGGDWPGAPDGTTSFPQRMLVDYVRVYRDADAYPTVSIDAPSALPDGGTVELSATAGDGGAIEKVEFVQGGGVLATLTEPPYTWRIDGAAQGCYTLSARATDDAGYTTETAPVALTVGEGCPDGHSAPFLIAPATIPGTVEAEFYDLGGPTVAYRDLGAANTGDGIRLDEGVDVGPSRDVGGGYEIVDIATREWLAYTVEVEEAGAYRVAARVAAPDGAALRLAVDGEDRFGEVALATTRTSYASRELGVTDLSAGRHTLRVDMRSTGFALNALTFERLGTTAADERPGADLGLRVSPNPATHHLRVAYRLAATGWVHLTVVDATGRLVRTQAVGERRAGEHVTDVDLAGLTSGLYAVVLTTPGGVRTQRVSVVR